MDALFKRLAGAIMLALALALVLGACVSLQPCHTTQAPLPAADGSTPPPAPRPPCAPGAACLAFAEFGNPFNRRQQRDTVARARQVAGGGGIVIVFVHGWLHKAHPDDSNLAAFNAVFARAAPRCRELLAHCSEPREQLEHIATDQAPHMMVLATQADAATGVACPLGRAVSTLFDSYADQISGATSRPAAGHDA
jgi:hypothetical protein